MSGINAVVQHRVKGRASLTRRLRALLLAVGRYDSARAVSADESPVVRPSAGFVAGGARGGRRHDEAAVTLRGPIAEQVALLEDHQLDFDERAGIAQFDGGLTRGDAEQVAKGRLGAVGMRDS